MYYKWTEQQTDKLKELYPVTESWDILQLEFPFSTKRGIQQTAANLGLKKPRLSNNYLYHREDLFDTWTEESAYILGYLEADGAIQHNTRAIQVAFATSIKDKEYLEKLKLLVGSTSILGISDVWINEKKYQMARFTVTSRAWKNSLLIRQLRTGMIAHATDYMHHYIRGYFDGDGSIYWSDQAQHKRSNFVFSNQNLASEFAIVLRPIVNVKLKIHRKTSSDRCWYFQLGNEATKKLVRYIYRDATIYLQRKHELASEYL